MPLALLLTMVGVGLSALLASSLTRSVLSTRSDIQRVQAVNAAQTGLNVALARILHSSDGPLLDPTTLPCTGAITGDADPGTPGDFQVRVEYFTADPSGASPAERASTLVSCAFDRTPRYALLTATGSDGHGGAARTLTATYAFPVADVVSPRGGLIRFHDPIGGRNLCLTDTMTVRTCADGVPTQTFAYRADLTLAQPSAAVLAGRCVQAGTGRAVTMETCDPALVAQQWVFNGRTFVSRAPGNHCLDIQLPVDGSAVELGAGARCAATADSTATWLPDPGVGAGYAGRPRTDQLVNGHDFARCLTAGGPATAQPCGQDAAALLTAQRWLRVPAGLSSAGEPLFILVSGGLCLSTGPAGGQPATVSTRACGVGDAEQQWEAPAIAATWTESFRIRDRSGRCLAASDPAADPYAFRAVVTACDGSRAQKWSVANTAFRPRLTNLTEE